MDRSEKTSLVKRTVLWSAFIAMGLFSFGIVPNVSAAEIKKNETGLYRDVFDDNIYYEVTSLLRLDRIVSKITGSKKRAVDVNLYGEVPDNFLYQNRHAKSRLSLDALKKGHYETDGPDMSKPLTVIKGKFEGLNPGFFVRDGRGDVYLLKFDLIDSFELRTSAEVVASKFLYAIGYNVPQYSVLTFTADQLVPGEDAMMIDDTGFKKPLTAEKLEEYLLFLPQDARGNYRASASKFLSGENKGYFSFVGHRKDDPNDKVDHRDRRDVRALYVFASWINDYDMRDSNTLSMLQTDENGQEVLRSYLIDFNSSLGAGTAVPMFAREHMIDYGEAGKAFLGLGFWEKTWQKRWRESKEQIHHSPAVGDFDNRYFEPEKFKTQLPYYAFKDLTQADAFWAAKQIMTFTDEEIKVMVETGQYESSSDAAYIARVLSERRDIIGKYWFTQATPLDGFEISGNQLTFKDLSVQYGFKAADDAKYFIAVITDSKKKVHQSEITSQAIDLAPFMTNHDRFTICIHAFDGESKLPFVKVTIDKGRIVKIVHQD